MFTVPNALFTELLHNVLIKMCTKHIISKSTSNKNKITEFCKYKEIFTFLMQSLKSNLHAPNLHACKFTPVCKFYSGGKQIAQIRTGVNLPLSK